MSFGRFVQLLRSPQRALALASRSRPEDIVVTSVSNEKVVTVRNRPPGSVYGAGTFQVSIPKQLPHMEAYRHLAFSRLRPTFLSKAFILTVLIEMADVIPYHLGGPLVFVGAWLYSYFKRKGAWKHVLNLVHQKPSEAFRPLYGWELRVPDKLAYFHPYMLNVYKAFCIKRYWEYHVYVRALNCYMRLANDLYECDALAPFLSDKYFLGAPTVTFASHRCLPTSPYAKWTPDVHSAPGPFHRNFKPAAKVDIGDATGVKASASKPYLGTMTFDIYPVQLPETLGWELSRLDAQHRQQYQDLLYSPLDNKTKAKKKVELERQQRLEILEKLDTVKVATVTAYLELSLKALPLPADRENMQVVVTGYSPIACDGLEVRFHHLDKSGVRKPIAKGSRGTAQGNAASAYTSSAVPSCVMDVLQQTKGARVSTEPVWAECVQGDVLHMGYDFRSPVFKIFPAMTDNSMPLRIPRGQAAATNNARISSDTPAAK